MRTSSSSCCKACSTLATSLSASSSFCKAFSTAAVARFFASCAFFARALALSKRAPKVLLPCAAFAAASASAESAFLVSSEAPACFAAAARLLRALLFSLSERGGPCSQALCWSCLLFPPVRRVGWSCELACTFGVRPHCLHEARSRKFVVLHVKHRHSGFRGATTCFRCCFCCCCQSGSNTLASLLSCC